MAPLALITLFIATLLWIVLLTLSVSIDLVSLSARVTSFKFQKGLLHSDNGPIYRTPGTPGSDKKVCQTFRA